MALEQIGELAIELAGRHFTLRPTWRAFAEIDSRLNIGLMATWSGIAVEKRMSYAAVCLWAFATNGGREHKTRDVDYFGELIAEVGFVTVQPALESMLARGLRSTASGQEDGDQEGDGSNGAEKSGPLQLPLSTPDMPGGSRLDA